MYKICIWNVRGLNSPRKQIVVRNFISQHTVGVVRLLETKVKRPAMEKLYQVMFQNWCFTSNAAFHKDGRVILAWNPSVFTIDIKGGAS